MNLSALIERSIPQPWSEGDNIPWHEPGFSRRMLREHLSQDHDAASRRSATIEAHVRFLHEQVLGGQPARILDLGCGPGLYSQRLARLGHTCRGIDFSPASIDYARRCAEEEGLGIDYALADLRRADFGAGFDLAMLIYGEFNVFQPADARALLNKAWAALRPGGQLLLEPSPEASIRALGSQPPAWSAQPAGLFSDLPHLLLQESFWDEARKAATTRYYVIDAGSGVLTRCAASYQAYSDEELAALLGSCGFNGTCFYPNLTGAGERSADFIVLQAVKPAG
jgi:SAM-dependent methyltransferase